MEQLLYHLWRFRLYEPFSLKTTSGQPFEVIHPGILNNHAGPDFFNAKIKINQTIWVGNIEIHEKSSDWYRHGHQYDAVYDSVVLHIVLHDDAEVYRTNGEKIPQFVMPVTERQMQDYQFLSAHRLDTFSCADRIAQIKPILINDWMTALTFERLIQKSEHIFELLDYYHNDWEEVAYILLAHSLGTGVNGEIFERLARSLSLSVLRKHLDSTLQVEALLLGQAGFLEKQGQEPYYLLLQREYQHLKTKFQLVSLSSSAWKMARMRPSSLPHMRIAFLGALLRKQPHFFANILEKNDIKRITQLFHIELHTFWETHYLLDSSTVSHAASLGRATINTLLINAVIPLLFAYAEFQNDQQEEEKVVEMLKELECENNRYIKLWRDAGMKASNAFDSQAVIQLNKKYCEADKCMYCRIGHQLLASEPYSES